MAFVGLRLVPLVCQPVVLVQPSLLPFVQLANQLLLQRSWLVSDLKSYVDSKYPVKSDREHTFIGGSSMGGLVSYYALMEHNDIFRCAACLSPSLWVANDKLVRLTKRASIKNDTVIYLDYGSKEAGNNKYAKRAKESFWNCIDVLKSRPINLNVHVIQDGEHNEASWEKRVPVFVEMFLRRVDK